MATQTTRIALRKPTREDISSVDEDVNNNFLSLEQYVAFMQVASTGDVTDPYDGLKVQDSSGNLHIYLEGQGWILISSIITVGAKGRKAYAEITTDGSATINQVEVMSNIKATFTAETGRRYWVESYGTFFLDAAAVAYTGVDYNLRWKSGVSVSVTDARINSDFFRLRDHYMYAKDWRYACMGEFVPNINGSVTVGLSYKNTFNNGTIVSSADATNKNIILVRDVGAA